MGFIRKTASLSTAGLVSYRSPKEAAARAAQRSASADKKASRAAAKRDKAEAKLLDAQRRAIENG